MVYSLHTVLIYFVIEINLRQGVIGCYSVICYSVICYSVICYSVICYSVICYSVICYIVTCYNCYML